MADNVIITQGSGATTTIAAEDIGGVMWQQVKLAVGTADSTAVIPSDATYGLGVDIKRGVLKVNTNNASGDAFSRLRVSEPTTLFDSSFEYDLQPYLFEVVTAGSGTCAHDGTNSGATLTVTTGTTDSVTLQSKQYHRYQPGKSQLVVITSEFGTASANTVRRVGYFDNNNGVFLEQNGTTDVAVTLRRNGSDTNRVVQANWNIDPMDGNGPSGHTLNLANAQILVIDLQWLGVGRVRVGFDIDGDIDYVHEFYHANANTGTYMKTACLPVRWQIYNTALAAGPGLQAFCSAVISEGGFEDQRGFARTAESTSAGVTVSTRRAILSIRPTGTFNGQVTRGLIMPEYVEIAGSSSGAVIALAEIVYSPTLTGTPTWTTSSNSMVEYSLHGDASAGTFTGGTVLWSGFISIASAGASSAGRVSLGRSFNAHYPLTLNAAGSSTSGTAVSLVLTTLSGGQFSAWGTLGWKEIR